ncbi:MAG: SEC10/PgrA surface exclusion domain-containing protein [Streptococcus mitis]|nr:SEC10/PgrA surface exclusion domain-containing protein [Streptococcus mitis]
MMKKLKTLTTSTAIALASVGGTAFAQEAQATPVPSNTAVNEPALVTKPQVKSLEKTEVPAPSTVKPALDAQKAVVKDAETKVDTAKTDVQAKQDTVTSTEKELATATQAVKDAEATTSQATPEKVAQVKDAQAKNVEAQNANQQATETVNEQIKAETKALADEQAKVATAQANLDQANKDVQTAEQAVSSAQSALDGTGLASAKKDLTQAQTDVKDAEDTVADAQTAFKNATKADTDRDQAIKSAETDVNTKNDAVKLAKEKLATANQHANSVESKLQSAQAELKSAQDKLANTGVDTVDVQNKTFHISDKLRNKIGASTNDITFKEAYDLWKANPNSDTERVLVGMGAKVQEQSSTKISESDKKQNVELDNMTDEQQKEISLYASKVLTAIHKQFGLNEVTVTDSDLRIAREQAKKYVERGIAVNKAGHINGAYHGENVSLANETKSMTMYELKQKVYDAIMGQTFADAPSKWGHSRNNFVNNTIGIATANVDGRLHIISTLDLVGGNVIKDETDTASLEKAVATAKSNVEQAETASENAKNALTKASTDYASALSLKTEAEKVLADAMATPLQAQVAENNLRLAEIALENAKTREAKANDAVSNFSASLADKKTALEKAQDALKEAKTAQTTASQAIEDASAKLATAQDMKAKAEAKLETTKAELTTAQSTLENLLSAYRTEHAKLVDLQTEYEALVDLAEKAQGNVVAKLPDGTVIAVPKVAPTAEALPEVNIDELKKALATGKEVTLDAQGNVVVKEKRETYSAPAVQSVENEKMSYSRVEKAKTLPNTGELSSVAMLVFGAILGTFGLVTVRRKN